MEIQKLNEYGAREALMGLGLSHKDPHLTLKEWWTPERESKQKRVADALANRGGGHDKFLRAVDTVWWIKAPRAWWVEFDTYKVGTTTQSESTMHTLIRTGVKQEDFDQAIPDMWIEYINRAIRFHKYLPEGTTKEEWLSEVKCLLPEGYMQGRITKLNYTTLGNMLLQRHDHRYAPWQEFCEGVRDQVRYPEWLPKVGKT